MPWELHPQPHEDTGPLLDYPQGPDMDTTLPFYLELEKLLLEVLVDYLAASNFYWPEPWELNCFDGFTIDNKRRKQVIDKFNKL